ncbi:hypothetical protein LCGC14_0311310 [marine sediment metagenome]|uniref:Uncharacterized protein n=1 Tax=marine sediment metagenome TaxID=412755 RepID=A0A0F9WU01_9ZZZZ
MQDTNLIDLSTRDGYDIAAAIRGPDFWNDGEAIKRVFTERIRWLAGVRGGFSTRRYLVSLSTVALMRREIRQASVSGIIPLITHYMRHVRDAASALNDKNLEHLAAIVLLGRPELDSLSDERIIELAGGE